MNILSLEEIRKYCKSHRKNNRRRGVLDSDYEESLLNDDVKTSEKVCDSNLIPATTD